MTQARAVVIGLGNEMRRDDGIGAALVAELVADRQVLGLADVDLVVSQGDPVRLINDWQGVDLAVVVDAVRCRPAHPGQIHRIELDPGQPAPPAAAGSHGLGVHDALRLACALGRAPGRVVLLAVEAAEVGHGVGLSPRVAAALPGLRRAVLTEIGPGAEPHR